MRSTNVHFVAVAMLLAPGCYEGVATVPSDTDGADTSTPSSETGQSSGGTDGSDPLPEDPPGSSPDVFGGEWRRLTRRELERTLVDVLTPRLGRDTAAQVVSEQPALAQLPEANVLFPHLDQAVGGEHVAAYVGLGIEFGDALIVDEHLGAFVGACAVNDITEDDANCLNAFIDELGMRVHRRPLRDWERAHYLDVAYAASTDALDRDGLRRLTAAFFNAPNFLYQVEIGEDAPEQRTDAEPFMLDDWELASRLSYRFWGTMPDDELFAAAEDGVLSTAEGWEREARRVVADARTAEYLTESFFRRWLVLDEIPNLDNALATPGFEEFAGDLDVGDELRAAMIEDVLASVRYHVWDDPGSYADWLTSPYVFAENDDLAQIYGAPRWDASTEPPQAPEGERSGLLTRPALMLHNTTRAHVIHRGAYVYLDLLCREIGAPPPDAESEPFEVAEDATAREWAQARTESQACAGCHSQLNPMGFVFSHYDALGRWSEIERVFHEAHGELLREAPVDARTELPGVPLEHPDDLSEVLTSGEGQRCAALHMAHFFTDHEQARDSATVVAATDALLDGTIQDALFEIARRPHFRQRIWRQ